MQQKRTKQEQKVLNALGEIIKSLRESKNISLNIFAFENDLQKSLISRTENGKSEIKFISLCKIAQGLDIKTSQLMKNLEDKLGESFSFNT